MVKNLRKIISAVFFFALAVWPISFVFAEDDNPYEGTLIMQSIAADTVWGPSGSPYILGFNFGIYDGATLTIEAGTVIKVLPAVYIDIYDGTMEVLGGEGADRVVFTSIKDDSVAGDTNMDGDASSPARADWGVIAVRAGSSLSVQSADILYGGKFAYLAGVGAIVNHGGVVELNDVKIKHSEYSGFRQVSGQSTIDSSVFMDNQEYGAEIIKGSVEFTNNFSSGHIAAGFVSGETENVVLIGNHFEDNNIAVQVALYNNGFYNSGNTASGNTINGILLSAYNSDGDLYLGKDSMPYAPAFIFVDEEGSLTIAPGVVMKMYEGGSFDVRGELNILGTAEEPVAITSMKDDTVAGDTNNDGAESSPAPGDWGRIHIRAGGKVNIDHTHIYYGGSFSPFVQSIIAVDGGELGLRDSVVARGGSSNILQNSGLSVIERSRLSESYTGILVFGGDFYMSRSSVVGNTEGMFNVYSGTPNTVVVQENWWGSDTGPLHPELNPDGLGAYMTGDLDFSNWLTSDPTLYISSPQCCSSVLFMPGVMASRLHDGNGKLWEPLSGGDIERLYLDEEGKSIGQDIYADEVIDEIHSASIGRNIYKSFIGDLAQKKSAGQIADYSAVPYDWRLSLPDILAADSAYIEQELRRLAGSSQTGRVTIVAHSNGGLVTKALLNSLGAEAASLVDQVVLVAVPQIGTPQAIGVLLHGYDSGIPFNWLPAVMSPAGARELAQNMPSAYQLLPDGDYYSNPGVSINTPLVVFEEGELTNQFIDRYGFAISNGQELHDFVIGAEGRDVPSYGEVKNPAIGNAALLAQAEGLAQSIGSSWQAPAGIVVHQIAGIGEDTLAGITYKTSRECAERLNAVSVVGFSPCINYQPTILYTPNEIIDGDGTVVAPSALAMDDAVNVKRWWVDLDSYNKILLDLFPKPFSRTEHKDILEIAEVRSLLVNNIITKSSNVVPQYIGSIKPNITKGNRLRFTLHSPLALSVVDENGNEVSENASDIPGATFKTYGEVQVVKVPVEANPTVKLNGIASGSFTLEIEEWEGDLLVGSMEFSGVPTATSTVVMMEFSSGTINEAGDMLIDFEGDGDFETNYSALLAVVPEPALATPDISSSAGSSAGSVLVESAESVEESTYETLSDFDVPIAQSVNTLFQATTDDSVSEPLQENREGKMEELKESLFSRLLQYLKNVFIAVWRWIMGLLK